MKQYFFIILSFFFSVQTVYAEKGKQKIDILLSPYQTKQLQRIKLKLQALPDFTADKTYVYPKEKEKKWKAQARRILRGKYKKIPIERILKTVPINKKKTEVWFENIFNLFVLFLLLKILGTACIIVGISWYLYKVGISFKACLFISIPIPIVCTFVAWCLNTGYEFIFALIGFLTTPIMFANIHLAYYRKKRVEKFLPYWSFFTTIIWGTMAIMFESILFGTLWALPFGLFLGISRINAVSDMIFDLHDYEDRDAQDHLLSVMFPSLLCVATSIILNFVGPPILPNLFSPGLLYIGGTGFFLTELLISCRLFQDDYDGKYFAHNTFYFIVLFITIIVGSTMSIAILMKFSGTFLMLFIIIKLIELLVAIGSVSAGLLGTGVILWVSVQIMLSNPKYFFFFN